MYMKLSSKWMQHEIHLHVIGHLANDRELKDSLFQLGFGAILSEKLRDLSPVKSDQNMIIQNEDDPLKLVALDREHRQYYRQAPIFIKKNMETKVIVQDLTSYLENGDVFLVYYEQDIPVGYFCVGQLNYNSIHGEGFLLQDTNTAQIKSAFIKPSFRGKGVGTALLNEAITWAKSNEFARLFVEHETANYFGSKFWGKYFSSYLYFSMRYIDNTI